MVQHVDQVFAAGMAEWLSSASRCCRCASPRKASRRGGTVLLAGTDDHFVR